MPHYDKILKNSIDHNSNLATMRLSDRKEEKNRTIEQLCKSIHE